MCERFRSRAAIGLLVICVSWVACAQTATPPTPTNESGKECLPPKVSYSTEPSPSYYPRKDSARTVLYDLIDEKGHLHDSKVTRWSGSREFDDDAIGAVKQWRFKSGTCDGKPISALISREIRSSVET
jgi:TonB family protein